jgi:hypothetical protein
VTRVKVVRNPYDGIQLPKPLKLDMKQAACRTYRKPELWFSDDEHEQAQAKQVCSGSWLDGIEPCPIATACLLAALDNDIKDGVWGGLSPRQRTDLKKKMQQTLG